MKLELTKRADYAIRAMLALARQSGDELLSARRIAEQMAIPARFLPQVMTDLSRAGLATAVPGRTGGHRLARSPEAITLLEVIEAVEGESRRRECVLRGGPCRPDGKCDVHDVFFAAHSATLAILSRATLASVARQAG